jgi:tetratricopeptide (TPR) repeat protein
MADVATIIALAGGIVGVVGGGGGIVSVVQTWRQAKRERTLDIWESYREQIKSAEARADGPEVERLRREYEGQHQAWRAQQRLTKLARSEISVVGAGSALTEEDVDQLKRLLAESAPLSPALLPAEEYFLRGNVYFKVREYQLAFAAYSRSLELEPDSPIALNNRGMALAGLGRYQEALADYNRSLELRPDDAGTLYNRACLSALQEKAAEAIDDLGRAIKGGPKYRQMARTEPDFDGIRSDPRFRAFVEGDEPLAEGTASP